MLALRLASSSSRPLITCVRSKANPTITNLQAGRLFRTRAANAGLGTTGRMTLKERLMQPTTGLPFAVGRGVVIGAAAVGMVSLGYYGSGITDAGGAFDRSLGWDNIIRDRIRTVYLYLGSGLVTSVAAASAVFRNPQLLSLVSRSSITAVLISMGAIIASSAVVQMLPYSEGLGAKQVAFLAHTSLIGAILAPLAFAGGPILIRAAVYTAGIVGGLSTIAVCAPSERFLSWGAPLGIGLGAVFAANIGALFLPPTSALGAGLAAIVVYGGLVLFSGFLLYDTQKIIRKAETHPVNGIVPFDPVNASMSVYMDVINIFIRLVMILGGGGNRRK